MSELIIPSIRLISEPGGENVSGCFLGGRPQLPTALEWPRDPQGRPLVHVAQITLDRLPRNLSVGGQDFPLPTFPRKGTFFVFAACATEEFYEAETYDRLDKGAVQVLFTTEDVSDRPSTVPPSDALTLGWDAAIENIYPWIKLSSDAPEALDISGPSKCYPQVPLLPSLYLTVGDEIQHDTHAPVARGGVLPTVEASQHFEEWNAICSEALPKSEYEAARVDRYLIPNWLTNTSEEMIRRRNNHKHMQLEILEFPEDYPWSWIMIDRVALHLWASVAYALKRDQRTEHTPSTPLPPPKKTLLHSLLSFVKASKPADQPTTKAASGRSWHDAALADIYGSDVPDRCKEWVAEAAGQDPFAIVPLDRRTAFCDFLKELDARIPADVVYDRVEILRRDEKGDVIEDEPIIRNVARSTISADYDDAQAKIVLTGKLKAALFDGLRSAWPEIVSSRQTNHIPKDFFGYMASSLKSKPHQMFGAGEVVQSAPEQMADKVLLLQVDTDPMANMQWAGSGILQLWMEPEHLAAGQFDQIIATAEGT